MLFLNFEKFTSAFVSSCTAVVMSLPSFLLEYIFLCGLQIFVQLYKNLKNFNSNFSAFLFSVHQFLRSGYVAFCHLVSQESK